MKNELHQVKKSEIPLVTIILPFFNSEATLRSAVESVLAQTFTNFELLLIDDGSKDASHKIASEFCDPRIRIIHQENKGTAAAQNRAFSLVTTKYVALHDSDDLWKKNKLQKHIEHLEAHPDVDVSFSFSQMISPGGKTLPNQQRPKIDNISLKDVLCHHPVGNGSNSVFRTRILNDVSKEYSEIVNTRLKTAHDIEMWVRIKWKTNCKFQGIPEILNFYRISLSSYSSNLQKKAEDFEEMLRTINEYAPELIEKAGVTALAFQYRYISRRAFIKGQGFLGLKYICWGLLKAPLALLSYEPSKTFTSFFANLGICCLPKSLVTKLLRLTEK